MTESGEIIPPTFELVHPEQPQDEVRIHTLFSSVFENLVEFSETLMAHMVAKNIENKEDGFVFELMYFPDGRPQNPYIRYGFGGRPSRNTVNTKPPRWRRSSVPTSR